MSILLNILIGLICLSYLKSTIVGSKFNFYQWIKYGKRYMDWYTKNIIEAEYTEEK